MLAALDVIVSLPGRPVAILGEMLELGDADRLNVNLFVLDESQSHIKVDQ